MLGHSSHNEDTVMWVEDVKQSISTYHLDYITIETTIQLIHRPCSSVCVLTNVSIKYLVSESRKYNISLKFTGV